MKNTDEPFEELIIPHKEMQVSSAIIYRVYKDQVNFELIEATSALDALAHSTIKNILKIERHNPMDNNVIQLNQVIDTPFTEEASMQDDERDIQSAIKEKGFTEERVEDSLASEQEAGEDQVNEAEAQANAENAQPENAASQEAPQETQDPPELTEGAEAAPLNNDDVERLLNG